ncbi:hypothetical protein AQ619_14035 [Caulobacter henricii]|uniref:PDZ domain-containing protein n=2 Tax=Caulobacter henricii TaxID=69395 RepID=A0A0P0P1N7_9CAUL|nr:hypothetical protein AQ619_14035 [Caulobacter henricii]
MRMTAADKIKLAPLRRSVVFGVTMLALAVSAEAGAKPRARKIGFSVQVMTTGLTKTTVAKIVVQQVQADSQAMEAGVAVGDELVRIDGTDVPGNSVFVLKKHMAFEPGVPKTVTFRRKTGAQFEAVFIRAAGL